MVQCMMLLHCEVESREDLALYFSGLVWDTGIDRIMTFETYQASICERICDCRCCSCWI